MYGMSICHDHAALTVQSLARFVELQEAALLLMSKALLERLLGNKGKMIKGRKIYERALTAIAMCKLALKYCHDFCPKPGELLSRKSVEDMILFVRQKMFVHLKGSKNNKSNETNKEEPVLTKDQEGHSETVVVTQTFQ
jgi:hypothetical protein